MNNKSNLTSLKNSKVIESFLNRFEACWLSLWLVQLGSDMLYVSLALPLKLSNLTESFRSHLKTMELKLV